MISQESIKYSLRNIAARKSRSMFTILSIFVGITTIFIFISFGWGLLDYVNDVSSGSSAQIVLITSRGGSMPGLDDTIKFAEGDLEQVEKTKGVIEASGVYLSVVKVEQDDERIYTFLMAYDPKVPIIMNSFNIDIDKGRLLSDGDEGRVLLGYNYQLPDKIFSKGYKVGDKIKIQDKKLRIVGFFESIGNPQDDSQIYIVNDYFDDLIEKDPTYGMLVAKVDMNEISAVVDRIKKNLRKSRGLEEGKEDFYVQSYEDIMEAYMGAINIVVAFIVLIASISVAVSAVNTANTMITSVLERTQEIGVIKSIGARNSEIFKIFLFESSFLGFISGVIGVIVGWIFTAIVGAVLDSIGWGFLSPHYSFSMFFLCIFFATITGAVSGVAPAVNASRKKPVDALRYE